MASYKILNQGGGAIIRVFPQNNKGNFNHLYIYDAGANYTPILDTYIPLQNSPIEFKIPIGDLMWDSTQDSYVIEISLDKDDTDTIYNLPDIYLDIRENGDGTWHYYAFDIY